MVPVPSAEGTQRRWRATRRLSAGVLLVWFGVTFGVAYFGRQLDSLPFGNGWGFWMAAQGAPLVYLVLVGFYARRMDRLDAQAGLTESD